MGGGIINVPLTAFHLVSIMAVLGFGWGIILVDDVATRSISMAQFAQLIAREIDTSHCRGGFGRTAGWPGMVS